MDYQQYLYCHTYFKIINYTLNKYVTYDALTNHQHQNANANNLDITLFNFLDANFKLN